MQDRYRIVTGPESIQGTKEWLDFRKGKIGASDAASIMGISIWETKLQCWERIQFDIKKPPNQAMKDGTAREEIARKWLNEKLGKNYQPVVLQSLEQPNLIASLDGYYENFEGKPYICEIKCGGIHLHGEALAGRIPKYYVAQMNHQMDLVGVNHMIYLSFYGKEGVITEVQKDEEYCQKLLSEELSFLASLIDFRPPPATDKDWLQITDPDISEKAERYKELSLLIDDLESERQEIRQLLEDGNEHPRVQIGDLKVQRVIRKGNIDYDKIPELQGVNLEQYRKKTISSWRFSL